METLDTSRRDTRIVTLCMVSAAVLAVALSVLR